MNAKGIDSLAKFTLKPSPAGNFYSQLVYLDNDIVYQPLFDYFNVTVKAFLALTPSLSSNKVVKVKVLQINKSPLLLLSSFDPIDVTEGYGNDNGAVIVPFDFSKVGSDPNFPSKALVYTLIQVIRQIYFL